jgi:Flp pilus assembly protein TadG
MSFRSNRGAVAGRKGSGAGGRGAGRSGPRLGSAPPALDHDRCARTKQAFPVQDETALPDPRPQAPGPFLPGPRGRQRGASAIWLVVIFVPVLLGLAGFALDLGMLYSAKGELKTAANSMALASAQNLIGTDAATTNAQAAAMVTVQNTAGPGNKYYFQGVTIGQGTGSLASSISDPAYYADAADAIASTTASGSEVGSAQAKYVRMTVTGETPLIFWGLLPVAATRKVAVTATAVAGISAPLCLACGIEPFAVAAPNQSDAIDFGFVQGTIYSFQYSCTVIPPGPGNPGGSPAPPLLGGASSALNYLLINRFDTTNTVFPDETSQAYQDGAGGMPGNTNTAQACFRINNVETVWTDANVNNCGIPVSLVVTGAICGLDSRFESAAPAACSNIVAIDTLSTVYPADTDVNSYSAYTDYTGNGRRIITIPVVDSLSNTTSMTVLGFRQFLLQPNSGVTDIATGDTYGRFLGMYIGSVAPVPQGRFDGCSISAGPGKVVLHQ